MINEYDLGLLLSFFKSNSIYIAQQKIVMDFDIVSIFMWTFYMK